MPWKKRRDSRNRSAPMCHILLSVLSTILLLTVLFEHFKTLLFAKPLKTTKFHVRSLDAASSIEKHKPPSVSSQPLLPNLDAVDMDSFPFVSQRIYSRDVQDTITAVLPIIPDSFQDLGSNIDSVLSTHSSLLHEIIVACHPRIVAKVDQAIKKARGSSPMTISMTILPWSETDSHSSGILHILPSVLTSHVLLLDLTALRYIEESTRMILLNSIPSGVPTGPYGFLVSPSNVSCVHSPEDVIPAAYLVPPFLAPTSLLIEAENGMRLNADTWAALGDRIVKASGAAFGGLVLSSSSMSHPWCTDIKKHIDHVFSPNFLQSFYQVLDQSTNHRLSVPTRLSILLPGRDELRSFSHTICEMAYRGYTLRIMLFSGTDANPSSHFALDGECHLHFESIPRDSSITVSVKQLKAWTLAAHSDVLMYVSEHLTHTMAIEASVEEFRMTGGTIVRVPAADLPFCEWMAMLSVSDWQNWHKPRIDLSVITNNRPRSLSRLLDSMKASRYYGDPVQVKINLEQTADAMTRQIAAHFVWTSGVVHVQHRIISAGLLPAVVEAWYPHDNDSYGVLLEDDVEVSPLFYAWIKLAILKYRYGPVAVRSRTRSLFGISLYQPHNLELRVEGRVPFDPRLLFAEHDLPDSRTPYLSQVPCSWGAIYFPEHFREFHDYLAVRLSEMTHNISEVIVPDIRSNRWTRSWKRYFNELVYLRGYVMLYPNYDLSLATNHVEIGAHVKSNPEDIPDSVRRQYDVPLMPLPSVSSKTHTAGLLELPGGSLPAWEGLPVLDLWGIITSHSEILHRGRERHELLSGCSSLPAQFTYDASELLCIRTPPLE